MFCTSSISGGKQKENNMTTTVIIRAHCGGNKEVRVAINDNVTGSEVENFRLQDGEKAERSVYDGREISVTEILK